MKMSMEQLLEQQDCSGMNLSGMSLGNSDLRGKNLRGADLSNAHLGYADLRGADLRNANLNNANLGAANLTGADLRYSDLRNANLKEAKLSGADLREAIGLNLSAPLPVNSFVKPIHLEETEEFEKAKADGYFPISHWGKNFALVDGQTLCKSTSAWSSVKSKFGDAIFADRRTFSEVRLVKQYKHYSQWAYLVTNRGFARIAESMGLQLKQKNH